MRFLVLPQHELAKFCLKPVSETQYISSSCTLCCMLSKLYASFTIKCIKNVLWPTNRKFIYFSKWFHAVLYIALENHVPLRRFPETFSMWYRIVFGTKLHRFHYCCNLWWVQPLYCINTLDYMSLTNTIICHSATLNYTWGFSHLASYKWVVRQQGNKMAAILPMTFSNLFSSIPIFVLYLCNPHNIM